METVVNEIQWIMSIEITDINNPHDVKQWYALGEKSEFIGCSSQPAAANLYRKGYIRAISGYIMLNSAAFLLQPVVMNLDVFPYNYSVHIPVQS